MLSLENLYYTGAFLIITGLIGNIFCIYSLMRDLHIGKPLRGVYLFGVLVFNGILYIGSEAVQTAVLIQYLK